MHEMALAEGVIQTALVLAREQGRPLLSIIVRVGQLQQIEAGVLHDCLRVVCPGDEPLLAGVYFRLETEPARLRCHGCGHSYGLDDLETPPAAEELEAIHFVPELAHSYVDCPLCGSPDFAVTGGRGVWLEGVELRLEQVELRT